MKMPIQTDDAWPAHLLDIFQYAREQNSTTANRYYGAYDKLLNYCFQSLNFFVAPQLTQKGQTGAPIDDLVVYIIVYDKNHHPVLLVEVKDDNWIESADTRYRADELMRQHYDEMLAGCTLPRLWGLSLLGTSLRVYCADKATGDVSPSFVAPPDSSSAQVHLQGEWNLDITSQEGFDRVKEIVDDMYANV